MQPWIIELLMTLALHAMVSYTHAEPRQRGTWSNIISNFHGNVRAREFQSRTRDANWCISCIHVTDRVELLTRRLV